MGVQINIRVDEETVEVIDGLAAARGTSRPAVVRAALTEWLKQQEADRIAAAYHRAYSEYPETDEEIRQAEGNARRLVADEPWEKWW